MATIEQIELAFCQIKSQDEIDKVLDIPDIARHCQAPSRQSNETFEQHRERCIHNLPVYIDEFNSVGGRQDVRDRIGRHLRIKTNSEQERLASQKAISHSRWAIGISLLALTVSALALLIDWL